MMAHDKLGQRTGSMEPKKDSEQLVLESGILGKSKVHWGQYSASRLDQDIV